MKTIQITTEVTRANMKEFDYFICMGPETEYVRLNDEVLLHRDDGTIAPSFRHVNCLRAHPCYPTFYIHLDCLHGVKVVDETQQEPWEILREAAVLLAASGYNLSAADARNLANALEEEANTPSLEEAAKALLEAWAAPGGITQHLETLQRALDAHNGGK